MPRKRESSFAIADDQVLDDEIRKWYGVVDLKLLAAAMIAARPEFESRLVGEVMFYVTCRAAELGLSVIRAKSVQSVG